MAKSEGFTGKPLVPSAAIADDFQKPILTLIRRMTQETKRELKALFEDPAYALDKADEDGNPSAQARIIINKLARKYQPLFRKWAKKSAKRMVDRTLHHSTGQIRESLKDVGEALNIRPDFMSDRLREITTASVNEAAGLIKLIPEKYLAEVAGQTMRSITTGKGMADLIPYLNDKYGQNIRHARLVAHDQTRKAFTHISTERMKAIGVKEFEWRHSHGGRHPRKLHEQLNGKVFRYDDPPYIGEMYGQPVYGLPAHLPNCFPGDSNASFSNGCHKLFRRRYNGKLTKIVADSGLVLKGTPNHPILTSRGWIALNQVQVGDDLFTTGRQSADGFEADHADNIARIGDVFDALLSVMGRTTSIAGGSAFEFHGDISDSEIDIIDFDALLPDEWNPEFCEHFCKFVFAWADKAVNHRRFFSDGSTNPLVIAALNPPYGSMSSFRTLVSLFGCHSAHAQQVRLRLISDFYASLNQSSPNSGSGYAESLCNLKLAKSAFISMHYFGIRQFLSAVTRSFDARNNKTPTAEFIGKDVGINAEFPSHLDKAGSFTKHAGSVVEKFICEDFSGHVFNLETNKGWYETNGIITHNCRCFARPRLNFGEKND